MGSKVGNLVNFSQISQQTEVLAGVFRITCEVTMQLLRDNRDSLMSVLDAFVHDPLVEWEDERRRLVCDDVFLRPETH